MSEGETHQRHDGFWKDTALGIAFIWTLVLVLISVRQGQEAVRLNNQLSELRAEFQASQTDLARLRSSQGGLRLTFAEFQNWRVRVTLASRMGWSEANRYIQNYPLEITVNEGYTAADGGFSR